MSLNQHDVESTITASGFTRGDTNSKRIQFISKTSGRTMYFIPGVGLPRQARLVLHPDLGIASLTSLDGVSVSEKALHHGSTLSEFPKRLHTGSKEIHYGHALNVSSLASVASLAREFHKL